MGYEAEQPKVDAVAAGDEPPITPAPELTPPPKTEAPTEEPSEDSPAKPPSQPKPGKSLPKFNKGLISKAVFVVVGLVVGLVVGYYLGNVVLNDSAKYEEYVVDTFKEIYGDNYQEELDASWEEYEKYKESKDEGYYEAEDSEGPEEGSAAQAARDVHRKDDVARLSTQLEIYQAVNGYYPSEVNIEDGTVGGWVDSNLDIELDALIGPSDITINSVGGYQYTAIPANCDNGTSGDCTSFTLSADLEEDGRGTDDADGDTADFKKDSILG